MKKKLLLIGKLTPLNRKKLYKKHHMIRGILVAALPHKEYLKMSDVTSRFPNNVNNTHNQSIQRKTECHTTFKV